MPYDLTAYLVIGVSSRALFDLEEENAIFVKEGLDAYSTYQIENEDKPLTPGVAFPLVKAILQLNSRLPDKRRAEVVIMSRNSAETSLRIWTSIAHHDLDITRAALVGGEPLAGYLKAYNVDLFLSADDEDVQRAINAGTPAAVVCRPPAGTDYTSAVDQIRIAFDGDAVLFSEESEKIYQEQGLEAFLEHEAKNAKKPLAEGPFAKLLRTISKLQSDLPPGKAPIRMALVTARNAPAHERVIRTFRAWGVRVDEAHFLGGASKADVLNAFGAHIFFDDQDVHLGPASRHVPAARVPYRTIGNPPSSRNSVAGSTRDRE